MLPLPSFFTDTYEDEILYSTIARYHYYYGNTDFKDTLYEIFGSNSVIPTIEFPSRLDYLCQQLKNKVYCSDSIIQNHTIYPLYSPFLPAERQSKIKYEMQFGDGKGIYSQIGITAGSICKKQGLFYCPKCVIEDKKKYGEPYFHRIHQIQGIQVCDEHNCKIKDYPISRNSGSRIAFIMMKFEKTDTSIEYIGDKKESIFNNIISAGASYLLNNKLGAFNQQIIHEKYRILLKNKGFMTYNGTVKQKELHDEFLKFYGPAFLCQLNSAIEINDTYNWLRMISEKPKRVIHPVRHILFINFLTNSIEDFFKVEFELDSPFGTGPWPCMNPVSEHFRENIISDCKITPDFKTRQPVGTFSCSCGFTYSRKGPDRSEVDKYKVGRIKQFGYVWENKLKELLFKNIYSIRELGRILDCDPKTIIRNCRNMGMDSYLKSKMKLKEDTSEAKADNYNQFNEQYKVDILEFIKKNPEKSRKEIRSIFQKQYAWLYRNDRKWIDTNFPERIPRELRNKGQENRVDWEKRDKEILGLIREEYIKILAQDRPVRITKSILGKRTGMSATLDINIDKLPLTNAFLKDVCESIESFQIRRVKRICMLLLTEKGSVKKWDVVRKAGLRPGYSQNVDKAITEFIDKINEGEK